MSNKRNEIYSPTVRCTWANLARPDEFKGSKKHTIQVEMTPEFENVLKTRFGLSTIDKNTVAGFLPAKGEYPAAVTIKTTEFTKQGKDRWAGNLVDIKGQTLEDYLPGSGDQVRVKIWVTENEKISLWLNGIQVIEQTQTGSAGGWEDLSGDEPVPAAPVAEAPAADPTDSADLPF